MANAKIIVGECLSVLRTLPSASIDAMVTDPPAGIGFMGLAFDRDRGGRTQWVAWLAEIMAECLRVAKPGAHAVIWAIPRTSHWTATAVEDAGWEIRDVAVHLQAQGWPKSQSLLKPAAEHWILAKAPGPLRPLGIDACRIGSTKEVPASVSAASLEAYGHREGRAGQSASDGGHDPNLGRWPANCTLEHAEGCELVGTKRIPGNGSHARHAAAQPTPVVFGAMAAKVTGGHGEADRTEAVDTWDCAPGCPVAMLDAQSGELASGAWSGARSAAKTKHTFGRFVGGQEAPREADAGGASRFFYCSKAKGTERNRNAHPNEKSLDLMRWLVRLVCPRGGVVLDAFAGSGTTLVAALAENTSAVGIEQERRWADVARARCGLLGSLDVHDAGSGPATEDDHG